MIIMIIMRIMSGDGETGRVKDGMACRLKVETIGWRQRPKTGWHLAGSQRACSGELQGR